MPRRPSKKTQKSETPNVAATRVTEMKEGIAQIEALVKEAAALATAGARDTDDILAVIEETVARLGSERGRKEELLREQAAARDVLERELTARVSDLENQLQKKDELMESREAKLKESWTKAQEASASVLEARLTEKEEAIRQKDSAFREMQESLAAQVHDLESEIRKKEELLKLRDAEIADLRAQLDRLHVLSEGSVTLTEDNVVILEEAEQGAEAEPLTGAKAGEKATVFGQLMREIVTGQGKSVRQEAAPAPRKSRWATLLAPVKKRN